MYSNEYHGPKCWPQPLTSLLVSGSMQGHITVHLSLGRKRHFNSSFTQQTSITSALGWALELQRHEMLREWTGERERREKGENAKTGGASLGAFHRPLHFFSLVEETDAKWQSDMTQGLAVNVEELRAPKGHPTAEPLPPPQSVIVGFIWIIPALDVPLPHRHPQLCPFC